MPGSVVFGDYVIERSPYGFDTSDDDSFDDEDEGFNFSGLGNNIEGIDSELVDVFLLFQEISRGRNVGSFGGMRRRGEDAAADGDSDDHENSDGMPLVSSLEGQTLSNRSIMARAIATKL